MSQKLPLGGFKWVEETSQFNKGFIKIYTEDSDRGYFIKTGVQCPEKLYNFKLHNDFSLLPERIKIEKDEKLAPNLHNKKECYSYKY